MRLSFALAILVLFTTCGKFERLPEGRTAVSFQVEGRNPTALLPGIMVYAVRSNNVHSRGARYVANEGVQPNWLIPNGSYHFFAFGYATSNMTGSMYCGSVLNKALSGGSVVVNLVLDDQGQCGLPPFAPPGFGAAGNDQTKPLYIGACASSGGNIGLTDATSGTCDGVSSRPGPGSFNSYRMAFPEFERWDPVAIPTHGAGALGTGCVTGAFVGTPVTANRSPPYGEVFVTQLEIFSDASCATYAGSFTMVNGMVNAGDNGTVRMRNVSDALVTPPVQMMKPNAGTGNIYLYLRNY